MRKELERIIPSEAGLSSESILKYINALEKSGTEMHGIMIARHGKVCAEGWWKPYSPMLRHGLQSLTKSYVSAAIGILRDEGKIELNERLFDILPEYMPQNPSENLKLVTVHDMLCMSSGLETMQDRTKETWVHDFFASPFVNRPGTKFFYSGIVTSVLGVALRKKTGLGLMDYLKPRLFDRIGIVSENLKWIEHPDGMEYGGGGLFATTEDNLRLGMLYLNGGAWDGGRILSEDWVKKASAKQMDSSCEGPKDNSVGYGYQMWMCQPKGAYRFDGAHGQFTIMIPGLDMAISINQFAVGETVQKTLDLTWDYIKTAEDEGSGTDELERKLSTLSLKRERTSYPGIKEQELYNRAFELEPNGLSLIPGVYNMLSHKVPKGIERIRFIKGKGELIADFRMAGKDYVLHVSMDGVDRLSNVYAAHDLPEMVYANGNWNENDELELNLRFIETCYSFKFIITAENNKIEVTAFVMEPFLPGGFKKIKISSI